VTCSKSQERIDVTLKRSEGTDGKISCYVRTEALIVGGNSDDNAVEFEDYLPKHEKIDFLHGESEKIISIFMVNEKVP
jgi:hypothetical protein